jgi:hypothetical protein
MDLQEMGYAGIDWNKLAEDRDRWWALCQCGNEPAGFIKCGEFLD